MHHEIYILRQDWNSCRAALHELVVQKEPQSRDLPVLRPDALKFAWKRERPWLQKVDGPARRLYLSPDRRTYILDPLAKIWKDLIGKTIAFTAPCLEQEWKDSRVFKYMVRKDDIEKCAGDMKFFVDKCPRTRLCHPR